jgi:glycosyltransferase involved in cell wall biosynthesis
MGWRFDLGVVKSLRTLARDERIDLVHTHNYRSTLLAALALHSIPRMNTSHGQVVEASRRLRAWQALEVAVVARNRLTVACSEYVRQWLISKGVPERKVRTIHNCATAPGTEANIVPLRASVSDLVAVYCGRLAEGKGVETFIRAVAQTPNVYGLLVGDGPARGDLETLAGELHARVEFVGFATDPRPYYAASDVVVLPSRMEALPMVLIEAMAQGKPVIATNVGGIPEIIADGETGILIEYGDVRALGEALTRLKSAALRQTMGVNGLRRWRDDFTPERMALALAQAYSDALGGE